MLYYFSEYETALLIIPGCNNKKLITFLINQYETKTSDKVKIINIKKYNFDYINNLPINIRINTRITIINNPLLRIYNLYNELEIYKKKYNDFNNINTFSGFIKFIFMNKENKEKYDILNQLLYILSNNDNIINIDLIINELVQEKDLKTLQSIFKYSDEELNIYLKEEKQVLKDDYIINYTDEYIRYIYISYFEDYQYFNFPLHKLPKICVNYPIKSKVPVFTLITPTVGNKGLLRLKEALKYEKIPFIHLVLWDTIRCKNALQPKDIEDENTFCYEFMHPYHKYPNQRNDVWLRGVGISLTNTPFVAFFDDDTWPDRNHLENVFHYIIKNKYDYTFCKRRMWEYNENINNNINNNISENFNNLNLIGTDNFESIGTINKMGYRLIDNSSLYLNLETARKVMNVFLNNQYYGDDRVTPKLLDNFKGAIFNKVLINHIAKKDYELFFKNNILKI